MRIPQIQISQKFGQIGLRYQSSQLSIHAQKADIHPQSPSAQMDIEHIPAQLNIDQSQAFAEEGLMTTAQLNQSQAAQGKQIAEAGVEDRAKAGEEMMKSKNPKQALSQWISRNEFNQRPMQISLVPSPFSVHIQYTPSQLSIHVTPGKVSNQVTLHQPQVQYQLGSVQTYVQQVPSLLVTSPPVGQLIDKHA